MSVREYRQSSAIRRQIERERRALLKEAWPVCPHFCAFCGQYVTRADASVHHLVPREDGGSDRAANLVLVHKERCHDRIELWTEEHGRPPRRDELGRLSGDSDLLTPGVGTRGPKRVVIPGDPPLSVDDPPRYIAFLQRIDTMFREQIEQNPAWGTGW